MKKIFLIILAVGFTLSGKAQTIITTTVVNGSLRVNDSLQVINNISTTGDIKATGEVISKDTMRAQKDIIIDGNATVGGNLKVAGTTTFGGPTNFNGPVILGPAQAAQVNPCLMELMVATPIGNGNQMLQPLNQAAITAMEASIALTNPCATPVPAPPAIIPFVWQTYGNHVDNNSRWIGTIENYDFVVKTNSIQRMVIKNNGQMFFGTQKIKSNHPHVNSQFQFDGKVGCKELVVIDPTKWADFVFDKNYKLLSLNEVEAFYLANKHLPLIPTEAEVKTNGINTAEMDALLLQKIEELTLYIVQQQKEIEALKKHYLNEIK